MQALLKKVLKPAVRVYASRFGPQRRDASLPGLWVLMYHRILPSSDERFHQEEPGMRVTPESFQMHLSELKRQFSIVSLGQWVKARAEGRTLPPKACAITFDDGWQDNYEYAFPLLKKYQVPATLFAVAEKIGTDFQFWPNIVAALLLSGAGPQLAAHPVLSLAGTNVASPSGDELAQCIKRLKAHTDGDIFQALDDIGWRDLLRQPMAPALMNWRQLREMQASGLVEVGSHTCTHRRLTRALDDDALRHEILASQKLIEAKLGEPVRLFCFPNGDYSSEALALVQSTHDAAVTTRGGINWGEPQRLHELTRIGMHDDISNTPVRFNARLSGWV